jgi:predicted outer membrane repeat protein
VEGFTGGIGGGLRCTASGHTILVNCTFVDNTAEVSGGAIYTSTTSQTTVINSVVWGNSPSTLGGEGIYTISFSDIEGGYIGTGNRNTDPLFVDPANGDYRLQSGSPAIDAGDNTAVPEGITTDLDGNPRFADDLATTDTGNGECPIVDMGSFEFPSSCPWDLDCDANVGITDFLALLGAWGTDPGGPPDFDGDGDVGINDFLELLGNWGPCP